MPNANAPKPVIDHVVVNAREKLDAACEQYRKLGFRLTPRGHHTLGSSNNLAIFGTDYMELLGQLPGRTQNRAAVWDYPAGLTGLVFKTDDPERTRADMVARGVPVEEVLRFSRPIETPEGRRDVSFGVVQVKAGEIANGRTFFCHHYTPELVWRPEDQAHENGAIGIVGFVIASREPARTAGIYERMFGPGLTMPVSGGLSFQAGEPSVLVLEPGEVARRFADAAPTSPDGSDRMVALVIEVRSLDAAAALLRRNGVPYRGLADGAIAVAFTEAADTAIVFTA